MFRLIKFEKYCSQNGADEIREQTLKFINTIREAYPYSKKEYNFSKIKDVYLIIWQNDIVGFCEVEVQNICIENAQKTKLYLHELHVLNDFHRKGIATKVITHILKLGLSIEFVVANDNTGMLNCIAKFEAKIKHEPKNVKNYIINPKRF